MFQIDRSANRLHKLERTGLLQVGIRESELFPGWLVGHYQEMDHALSKLARERDGRIRSGGGN